MSQNDYFCLKELNFVIFSFPKDRRANEPGEYAQSATDFLGAPGHAAKDQPLLSPLD
jgi:hypothetical protein